MIKPNKFVFETAKALIGLFSDTEEIKNIRKNLVHKYDISYNFVSQTQIVLSHSIDIYPQSCHLQSLKMIKGNPQNTHHFGWKNTDI